MWTWTSSVKFCYRIATELVQIELLQFVLILMQLYSRSRQPNKVIFSARLSDAFCSEGFGAPPERLVSTEDQTLKLYVTTVS